MKCFYHEDREGVATCQYCGKSLCKECASRHTPCLCDECARILQRKEQECAHADRADKRQKYMDALVDTRAEFIRTCLMGVLVSAIMTLIVMQDGDHTFFSLLLQSAAFFCVPFGWKLLTYLQSFIPLVIVGSFWFWLWWVAFKTFFSVLIGIPALIYQIIKTFVINDKINKVKEEASKDVLP